MKYKLINYFFLLATLSVLFTACLKEKYPIDSFTSNITRPIAQFTNGDSGIKSAKLNSLAVPIVDEFAEFDLTEIGMDTRNILNGIMTINIEKDNSLITAYNNAKGTAYEPLPESAGDLTSYIYTIDNSKKNVKIRVKVKGASLQGESYALALKISTTSQGEISKLRYFYITQVKAKNNYEGAYASEGVRTRYAGPLPTEVTGTFPWSITKYLNTINTTTCELASADPPVDDVMYLTVNLDNTVTITSGPNGFFETSNDGPCSYNPASKIFTLNYKYYNTAGNIRKITETLVAQ
jgi:hypothetical protein